MKRNRMLRILLVLTCTFLCLTGCKKSDSAASPYMEAVNNLAQAYNGDAKALEKIAPKDAWDYLRRQGFDSADHAERVNREQLDFVEEIRDLYGKDAYVTITVSDAELCGEESLENIEKAMNKIYGLKRGSVETAYKMDRKLNVVGTAEVTYESVSIYAVEIDGQWYILYNHSEEDNPILYFPFLSNKEISLSS